MHISETVLSWFIAAGASAVMLLDILNALALGYAPLISTVCLIAATTSLVWKRWKDVKQNMLNAKKLKRRADDHE